MSTLAIILITCGVTLLLIGAIVVACLIREKRRERRILKFNASDFNALGTVTRNNMALRDLKTMYRKVKYAVTYAANRGKFSTFVSLGSKTEAVYGAQFNNLFLNPFIDKLQKEGFTVKYLPNGSMEMDKKKGEPAFEISWKNAGDQDTDEEGEIADADV